MTDLRVDPHQFGNTIIGLRVAVLVAWTMIGLWGFPSLYRIVIKRPIYQDYLWAPLTLLSAGLLIFQVGSLSGLSAPQTDRWTAIGLVSLLFSAGGVFVSRALKAPAAHKRAALLSHMGVLIVCFGAGMLS